MLIELDQYCMRGGEYVWTPELNERARRMVRNRIMWAFSAYIDFVVADVCCGNAMDIRWIVQMAILAGYDVFVQTLVEHHGSVHGVRPEDYEYMRSTMISDDDIVREFPAVHLGSMPTKFGIGGAS